MEDNDRNSIDPAENLAEAFEGPAEDQSYTVSDDFIRTLIDHLNTGKTIEIQDLCAPLPPADMAEIISKIGVEKSLVLVDMLGSQLSPDVYVFLNHNILTDLFDRMKDREIAVILNQLESDDALNLIEGLDEDFQQQILKTLSKTMRAAIEEGLTFPEDSAGRLMQRSMVAVPQFWTVGKTIDFLRAAKDSVPDNFYDIIVVDPMHHVVGEVPAGRILRAPRNIKIEDLALEKAHPVRASIDQEEVAFLFRREGLVSAPVVNDDNRLIGVITVDDIVDVIDEEAEEDFLKIGGVANIDIYRPVWDTTKARFYWLCLNMVTAIAASIVIGVFEVTLDRIVALAILMPIVASMGGNAGTQALTVAVRALATKDLSATNAWRVIGKEVAVGTMNGMAFALISGILAWLWFSDPLLGTVIGAAMVINLMVAGLSGAAIPIILNRYGLDPALSSSIFLTTITDIIGFFAFLGLAALVLI